MTLGTRLRTLRTGLGMSQAALASAAGISKRTVGRIEADGTCYAHTLARLERCLGLDPDELVADWDQPPGPLEPDYGSRVRLRREELGLSLQSVAEACGVSAATVSRFECGRCVPTRWFVEWVDDAGRTREALVNRQLAAALRFGNARVLHEYCMTEDVSAWETPNGPISTLHLPEDAFAAGVPASHAYPYRHEVEDGRGWYRSGRTRASTRR